MFIECHTSGSTTAQTALTTDPAPPGARTWTLSAPLRQSWPASAQVWYQTQAHVASVDELKLSVGQTIAVELNRIGGDYAATKLTNAVPVYRYQ